MSGEYINKLIEFLNNNKLEDAKKLSAKLIFSTYKEKFEDFEQSCLDAGSQHHELFQDFFVALFKDEAFRKYMVQEDSENIIITSYYIKQHIITNLYESINSLLKNIYSFRHQKTVVFKLLVSFLDGELGDEPFFNDGNLTKLKKKYEILLETYKSQKNIDHGSYDEQATYVIYSFIRAILRLLDYIYTLITTGELKAGSYEKDQANGGSNARIKLPEFKIVKELDLFVKKLKDAKVDELAGDARSEPKKSI